MTHKTEMEGFEREREGEREREMVLGFYFVPASSFDVGPRTTENKKRKTIEGVLTNTAS